MTLNKIAIATNALGKGIAGHSIQRRLQAAHAAGFQGVEVAMECLEAHAKTQKGSHAERMVAAAADIYRIASSLSLEIIALNPTAAYDALNDPRAIEARLKEIELMLEMCHVMHAPILQIPSCTYPVPDTAVTADYNQIAANLNRLCLLAQSYGIILAYEAVAWGIHVDRWQQTRDIISLVHQPNIKLCLDTFHIAAREVGSPFDQSAPVRTENIAKLSSSLRELKSTVKASDIAYFQLSDAQTADPHQRGYPVPDLQQPPFMTQSRNCRMFPCEPAKYGGTLPALDVAKAVFATGYKGWVSMEVFHTDLYDSRLTVPEEWAKRGMDSWKEVARLCGLEGRRNVQARL